MKINVIDFEKKYLNPEINRKRKIFYYLSFGFIFLSFLVSVFINSEKMVLYSLMGFFLTFMIDYVLYFTALDFTKLKEPEKTLAIERTFRMIGLFVALSIMVLTAIIASVLELTKYPFAKDLTIFVIISMITLLIFVFVSLKIRSKTIEEKLEEQST